MARSAEYLQAYRAASGDALRYLSQEADFARDPRTRQALESLIFKLEIHLKLRAISMDGDAGSS